MTTSGELPRELGVEEGQEELEGGGEGRHLPRQGNLVLSSHCMSLAIMQT